MSTSCVVSKPVVSLSHYLYWRDKNKWKICQYEMLSVSLPTLTLRLLDSRYWEDVGHGSGPLYCRLP